MFRRLWTREAADQDSTATAQEPATREPSSVDRGNLPNTFKSKTSADASTAGKVILHLYSLGRLGNDEVGLTGYTQGGMSEAIGIRQGTLAKVLLRLRAAKIIEVDRRHVRGEPRRLNVYRLTALGESVGRELRVNRIGLQRGTTGARLEGDDSRPAIVGELRS
jgi:DNA-binding MarR family transcriptional regulator